MSTKSAAKRFIYRTEGVCPPEIHFRIRDGVLERARFIGGGCPGNARLVTRLLEGAPVETVLEKLGGIDCRNDTSCPDQLRRALRDALAGSLPPAESFRVVDDPQPRGRIAIFGDVSGDAPGLKALLDAVRKKGPDAVYCMGNLTGGRGGNGEAVRTLRKSEALLIQGDGDFLAAEAGASTPADLSARDRDWLLQAPQVLTFRLGTRRGVCFFGRYIQELPGYSDFEPYALEMNMVGGLADFMRDEAVFPALETMAAQFRARIVVFGETRQWGHWRVGETDIVSVGSAAGDGGPAFGLLAPGEDGIVFETVALREGKNPPTNR